MNYSYKYQQGAGLIEVLIAMLIIGVGLLGIAGLQTVALKSATQASLRSLAVDYASSLADRIRANQAAYDDYIHSPSNSQATPKIARKDGNNRDKTKNGNNRDRSAAKAASDTNACAMTPEESNFVVETILKNNNCDNPTTVALEDIKEIESKIQTRLPNGTIAVTCDDCKNDPIFHVSITWKGQYESSSQNANTKEQEELNEIVLSFNPGKYRIPGEKI